MLFENERKEMCEVAEVAFNRNLTNAAGGNFSSKINDNFYLISPTLMSQQKFCRLKPEDILVIDKNRTIIEGNGGLTREINMHMAIYEEIPHAKAVLHAHPKESMVFACSGFPFPRITESTQKLGEIITLPFAPATSELLAKNVREYVKTRKQEVEKNPIAMLLNKHGVVVVDNKGIKAGLDILERVEYEAYVNIQTRILRLSEHMILDEKNNKNNYNLEE